MLSGKYNDGVIPAGSRYDTHGGMLDQVWQKYMSEAKRESTITKLRALGDLAREVGYTQAQLALAWAVANKDVSTCILGFTKLAQVCNKLPSPPLINFT